MADKKALGHRQRRPWRPPLSLLPPPPPLLLPPM
jgi:hypothetical protein